MRLTPDLSQLPSATRSFMKTFLWFMQKGNPFGLGLTLPDCMNKDRCIPALQRHISSSSDISKDLKNSPRKCYLPDKRCQATTNSISEPPAATSSHRTHV